MNWRFGVRVRGLVAPVVDLVVVDGPQSLIAVLVRPNLQIHPIVIEETLQAKQVQKGQAHSGESFMVGAVVRVQIAAVHGPMAHHHDPRVLFPRKPALSGEKQFSVLKRTDSPANWPALGRSSATRTGTPGF